MPPPIPKLKLRSKVDEVLLSGSGFAWVLAIAVVLLAGVMAAVQALVVSIELLNQPLSGGGFFERYWESVARILTLGGEATWGERLLALLYWGITISVTATIIGFIAARMQILLHDLRRGRGRVEESGHVLILGWSPRLFPILEELAVANESSPGQAVVVMADLELDAMRIEVSARTGNLGPLRLVLRQGDPTNVRDLSRVNVPGAKSILIVDPSEGGDATAIAAVLAVQGAGLSPDVSIVVEVDDAPAAEVLRRAMGTKVIPVCGRTLIAQVTAQASRQCGLGAVVSDLLDFDGQEIYFTPAGSLVGSRYVDAQVSFPECAVLGLLGPDGAASLNPKAETVIGEGSELIVIAEDDSTVRCVPSVAPPVEHRQRGPLDACSPEHILVVGWSAMGQEVLAELAPFLPGGSTVHVAAREDLVAERDRRLPPMQGVRGTLELVGRSIEAVERIAIGGDFTEVLVLAYRSGIPVSAADALTILTALHLRRTLEERGRHVRVVMELLDSRRAELAGLAHADDLVVSDRLAALMMAQLSENPRLEPVLDELFHARGADIRMRPALHYFEAGEAVSFRDCVLACAAMGESAIGYCSGSEGGVRLNPRLAQKLTVRPGDSIVVVGGNTH